MRAPYTRGAMPWPIRAPSLNASCSWVCLTVLVFILVLLALETDTRQALYLVPVWFVLLAVGDTRPMRLRSGAQRL